jgi:thiol-disulfide isomerase/thioredoxin
MKNQLLAALVVMLGILGTRAHADQMTVSGKVVDSSGKPVAGVEVAWFWNAEDAAMKAYQPAVSDAQGRFTLKVNDGGRPVAVLGLDKERKTGALVSVDKKSADNKVTLTLGPLVRVKGKFSCKELAELGGKLTWTNLYMLTADGSRIVGNASKEAAFDFVLPPGTYKMHGYGTDMKDVRQDLTLRSDQPVLDLQTIEAEPTVIARHKGKAPPAWHISDARGVKKEVQLADYKGKWVLVEFFTHWCGPCVAQSLPGLMDFYDEHKEHRGQFEILAVHVQYAKDFADYDDKMKNTRQNLWHGQDLPFPVLLDDSDQTIKAFGIRAFPTTILIDPEGKLVGEANEMDLEKKLPRLPLAVRLPRALDRQVAIGLDDTQLKVAIDYLARLARVEIRLDDAAQKMAKDTVPLKLYGSVSLRSALNLLLAAYDLTFVTDDKGFLITPRKGTVREPELSGPQKACAKRIAERLGNKISFDFQGTSLADVAAYFEQKTQENFVLDPAARKAGTLDAAAKVTGAGQDLTLEEGLQKLLQPLGLMFAVRDEVIVITPQPRRKALR